MERKLRLSFKNKLFTGRVLTRSGDQAWDFAVPIAILKLVPGEIQYAAFYYFLIKLFNVIFLPRVTSLIDKINRFKAAKFGILIQLIGVILSLIPLLRLSYLNVANINWQSIETILLLVTLITGGILSSVGSSFMDISIANDIVPSSIDASELPKFNSRLRQIDLFTELLSPILAGLLLTIELDNFVLFGFGLIALWNVLSFFPEFWLLKLIFKSKPHLLDKKVVKSPDSSFVKNLMDGWQSFLKKPIAIVALAYACLWLSVLSPHGVLLTGFLKDGWKLPEWGIGVFRGLGGFFGLFTTFVFPKVIDRIGLVKGSQVFLLFQLITVSLALICFIQDSLAFKITFLVLILFSRVGLYGFSLGEMQLRQLKIPENVRGSFNGFATALTGIATIGLYGSGALLPSTSDFIILVVVSVLMVLVSFILFEYWAKRDSGINNESKGA